MLKRHKKTLILGTVLLLVPIAVGLLLWDRLPERVPTHWGIDGTVDGWSSRAMAVFGLPSILLAAHWFCVLMTAVDPKTRKQNAKPITLVLWICPVMSLITCGATYAAALGVQFEIQRLLLPAIGVLFLAIGNYMPKCRPNYTIGIKLPWTLNDDENWTKTHRLAGIVWSIGGIVLLAAMFLPAVQSAVLTMAAILVLVLIPTVYSYLLYRRKAAAQDETDGEA